MSKSKSRSYAQIVGNYEFHYTVERRGLFDWFWQIRLRVGDVVEESEANYTKTQLGAMFAANYAIARAKRRLGIQ